jgi:hypothetical protein
MWGLWWTEWHWNMFFSELLGFPLSVSFHRGSSYSYSLSFGGKVIGPFVNSHPIDMNNEPFYRGILLIILNLIRQMINGRYQ